MKNMEFRIRLDMIHVLILFRRTYYQTAYVIRNDFLRLFCRTSTTYYAFRSPRTATIVAATAFAHQEDLTERMDILCEFCFIIAFTAGGGAGKILLACPGFVQPTTEGCLLNRS